MLDERARIRSSWASVTAECEGPGEWWRVGVRGGAKGMRGETGGVKCVDGDLGKAIIPLLS